MSSTETSARPMAQLLTRFLARPLFRQVSAVQTWASFFLLSWRWSSARSSVRISIPPSVLLLARLWIQPLARSWAKLPHGVWFRSKFAPTLHSSARQAAWPQPASWGDRRWPWHRRPCPPWQLPRELFGSGSAACASGARLLPPGEWADVAHRRDRH